MAERDYIATVNERVVVFDGGMGATLEQFDLSQEDYGGLQGKCHEALVLNRPDVIEGVHRSMLDAGADVVETDSFQGSRLKLEEWGLGEHTLEINTKAAEIARKAAGTDRFVAGSIGPTGFLPASTDPTLGNISFGRLAEVFAEQATGLVNGGADLIIIETAQDILEVKAAIFGARQAFKETGKRLPLQRCERNRCAARRYVARKRERERPLEIARLRAAAGRCVARLEERAFGVGRRRQRDAQSRRGGGQQQLRGGGLLDDVRVVLGRRYRGDRVGGERGKRHPNGDRGEQSTGLRARNGRCHARLPEGFLRRRLATHAGCIAAHLACKCRATGRSVDRRRPARFRVRLHALV